MPRMRVVISIQKKKVYQILMIRNFYCFKFVLVLLEFISPYVICCNFFFWYFL